MSIEWTVTRFGVVTGITSEDNDIIICDDSSAYLNTYSYSLDELEDICKKIKEQSAVSDKEIY